MQALARTFNDDCYSRAVNDACINGGPWTRTKYKYDPLNNIRARTGTAPLDYGYNAVKNRLDVIGGAQSRNYSYNDAGEITGDGLRSFTLNSLGQITAFAGATYTYDGNAKRIKAAVGAATEYALCSRGGALVYVERGVEQIDYVALGGQKVELKKVAGITTATYLHSDILGSPRKASGAGAWQEHYDPFGQRLNGGTGKIGHTGHAFDAESGLTYMQARFYDPLVGRFLSTDPVYFSDKNPFTFNRYAYANNNPYKYIDPSGMSAKINGLHDNSLNGIAGVNANNAAMAANIFNAAIGAAVAAAEKAGFKVVSGGSAAQSGNQAKPGGNAPAWRNDPNVSPKLDKAWADSKPHAPAVPAGQPGSQKREQGGWITQGWITGAYDVVRIQPGTRNGLDFRGTKPVFCLCTVVGWFHTHPNTEAEGYLPAEISTGDLSTSRNVARVPGIILQHGPDVVIPYP